MAGEQNFVLVQDHSVSPIDQARDQTPPIPPRQWSGVIVQHREDYGVASPNSGNTGNFRLRPAPDLVNPDSEPEERRHLGNHGLNVCGYTRPPEIDGRVE